MNIQERIEEIKKKYDIPFGTEPKNRLHEDNDIALLMLLHPFINDNFGIIGGADHDIIYLNVNEDKLMEAPDDVIHDMIALGGFYSEEFDGICRFV
jgi:hypothetical protein